MQGMFSSRNLRWFSMLALAGAWLSFASAQYYGGGYPYPQARPEPPRSLPRPAQNVGGFQGNPFRNSTVPPTGLPIGTSHNFFGAGTVRTNPMAHSPTPKPFSNVNIPGPLVTSRQAARIEVANGLWTGW